MAERHGLRETSPGHWRIWVYVDTVGGKQRQVSKQFPAKGVAAARRRATVEATKLRGEKLRIIESKGTVADLCDQWQKAHDPKDAASTIYRRRSILAKIVADLGAVRLEDLTPRHIEAWYDSLVAERKDGRPVRTSSTVHHYHRQFDAVLSQGEKWDMLERNPMRRVEAPKRNRKRPPKPPTVEQLVALRESAAPELRLAIRLAIATGLRRGELMGLRMSDLDGARLRVERAVVDVPGRKVSFKGLKHEKPRTIHLDPGTVEAIHSYHAGHDWRGDVMVLPDFEDESGQTPRRPGWLSKAWARLCVDHDVHYRLHDLRHAHATMLHAIGIPMAVISERIGHDQLSTTMDIYTSAEASGDALAADAIGRMLDGERKP